RTRRENRRATQDRCQGAGAGGRLCHRTGAHPRAARIPDHQVPHDPHHRHRRGASLRRPGAGAPRHAGVERPVQRQVREALCGARGGRARGRQAVCRRGTRGPVSRARAFVSEVNDWTRRDVLAMLAAAAWTPFVPRRSSRVTAAVPHSGSPGFRVRTITAGTNLKSLADTRAVEAALATLKRAKQAVTDAGYEVQTVRIATQPLLEDAGPRARGAAMSALQALDRAVVAESALLSIGPVLAPDGDDPEFGGWAAELARTTQSISFTVRVASPERGPSPRGVTAAGDAMAALARAPPAGIGTFRLRPAANGGATRASTSLPRPARTRASGRPSRRSPASRSARLRRSPAARRSRTCSRVCGSRCAGIRGSCSRCWKIRCWRDARRKGGSACAICCCIPVCAARASTWSRCRGTVGRIAWLP